MTTIEKEQVMCGLFAEVLGLPDVDREDSFFDIGGHSLLASKLVRIINSRYGVEIPMRRVYQNPTAGALAAFLVPA